MARILNLTLPNQAPIFQLSSSPPTNPSSKIQNFGALHLKLRCNGRFSCFFSDSRKQEEARKSLESAFGENTEKFKKWDQEIKKREKSGGGGDGGGGGWFGWGGWFNGDNFWQESQQLSLALLGIAVLYLIAAKGDVLLAVVFNPLLFALRSTRDVFTYGISRLSGKSYKTNDAIPVVPMEPAGGSAKDRVVQKWGTD